jgi:Flp pilus assembly protein TadD
VGQSSLKRATTGARLRNSTGHYDLGVLLFQAGDYPGAEQSARRALELSKDNAQIHLFLGLLLARRVETRADAAKDLQHAAQK